MNTNFYSPKVSIVIPVYNVEKYLRQCLDSIVNQTLSDIEIIIVNDGSTDNSLSIINEYANNDSRIIVIDKKNSGYGHSMNTGLNKAKGKYIGILESDDYAELNTYELLYNLAIEHDSDIVKSDFYFYWSQPAIKNTKANIIPEIDAEKLINPNERISIFWSMPCIWSAIYKKDFLTNNKIQFLETPGASYQDVGFNFKTLAYSSKVYLTNTPLIHYRQDNENSSINSKGKVFCVCDEYNALEEIVNNTPALAHLKEILQHLKFSGYTWNFERLSWPHNYQFLKVMSKEFKEAQNQGLISKQYFEKSQYKRVQRIINFPKIFFIKRMFKKFTKQLNK